MRRLAPLFALSLMLVFAAQASALPNSSAQGLSHRDSCGVPAGGAARCHAEVVTDSQGHTFRAQPNATGAIAGWHSADLESAYGLTSLIGGGSGRTIAIVDAYDAPNAADDLTAYRAAMNLGAVNFTKVNQSGAASPLPSPDTGWAEEISLDLDMASSACPKCNIVLVEANSNSFSDLMKAVDTASTYSGVAAVSNSYGAREFSGETTYDSHFNRKGVAITVSSGDGGYGVEYPAASQYVTAAGGTSLSTTSTGRGWTESAWSGAGSGCSAYEPTKPSWQHDSGCSRRMVADVSSVSDPYTGVSVYDTYNDPGWMVFGGTSAAAPFIAGVYGLGGVTSGIYEASLPYGHTSSLFDVSSGSNGHCRRQPSYFCNAVAGYDGPTGLGTPNGTGAF
jgi:hypothetical protein